MLGISVRGNLEQTFGRYRLLERLGEGGMAEVFKAKSFGVEGFEKVLVIKRILPKLAEHPKFVDMFVHEAKLAVRLSHANIVQVFDLGRVDHPSGESTSYFIAMEYVPGLDLATLLARCRRLKIQVPFGMAVFLTAEVAKALDHAHRRRDEQARPLGIVHRDISPQNILLSWEGEVKVTDFGIAKAKDSISDDDDSGRRGGRQVRGKLAYMSPEQSKAEPLDGRSDLFSLGTVLYEMIAGNNPFVAPTAYETLRRVQASEFPPIELLRSDTPKPLIEIVTKMLTRRPEDRIAEAGRLHEHLLGYFYASGERFGASRLAEFLEQFHEERSLPEIADGGVFSDERSVSNDRTPVEVPTASSVSVAKIHTTSVLFKLTGERPETGQFTRTTDIGERREVTALVLSLLEADRSATTLDVLTVAAGRAREVLARYGAWVLEEDASHVVALFGLGDADGRDTEAAVRAAMVILRARSAGVVISAGVHVARIVVDGQGAPVKDERLASLVASAQALARATEGRTAVSQLASRIIRTEFTTEDLPGAGRTAPEDGRIVSSARSPSAVYGRFVGRHDELKRLGDILASATRRRIQFVSIEGDKGIGKTRLLAEMDRRLFKGNYNVGFYIASCPKNGVEVPWSGVSVMLRVLCGIQEGDDEARILDVLPRLRALGLHSDECAAVLLQLGASSASAGKPSQDVSVALRTAFTRMTHRLCEDRLHCFCWDDAHAMDKATIETIASIALRGRPEGDAMALGRSGDTIPPPSTSMPFGLRAAFIFATRSAPPDLLVKNATVHRFNLGELSDADCARLISIRTGARSVAPDLLAFCRERAGGHPLFLEELLKELSDSGAIQLVDGEARAKLEGGTAVPRTLRTLIAGRVSRLDTSERAILHASAILGEPILTQVLAALLKQGVAEIDRTVTSLFSKDLLRASAPSQVCFASPIHGEIVLDTIPPEARRELHAAAAAAFIAVLGEDSIDHRERIGHHLYEAGDRDRAATCFAKVALHKAQRGQLEPAIRLLCRALDLVIHEQRPADELARWLNALADAVSRVRHAPDLTNVAARAIERIDAVGALEQRVVSRVDSARAFASVNLFEEASQRLQEAFSLAGDDPLLRSKALIVEIEATSRSGDIIRSLRAVEQLEALGPLPNSQVLLAVSYVRAVSGHRASALSAIDQAAALDPPDDLIAAVEREKQRVLVYLCLRDFHEAVEASAQAVDLARATGARFAIAATLHNLGDASRRLGDLPRAYAALTESKEVCDAAGHERLSTLNRIYLAYLDGMSGVAAAPSLLRDLLSYVDSRGFVTDTLEGRCLLGALLHHRGEIEESRRELEQVLIKAREFGNRMVLEDAREILEEATEG